MLGTKTEPPEKQKVFLTMLLPSSPSTPPFKIMLYLNHVTIPPAPTPPFEIMLLLLPQEFYTLYFVHIHFSFPSSSQINPHLLTHLTLCSLFLLGCGPSPGVWLAHPPGHPRKENNLSAPSGYELQSLLSYTYSLPRLPAGFCLAELGGLCVLSPLL